MTNDHRSPVRRERNEVKSKGERPALRPYVIYYGWLTDDERGEPNDIAHAIAAVGAPLLIAHLWTAEPERHRNLSPEVLALVHEAGAEVFGYVATGYGRADRGQVSEAAADNLNAGVDGIFFDEADSLVLPVKLAYYRQICEAVRSRGRKVILNTGVAHCGEGIMDIADLLMVEHQWRAFATESAWARKYPPDRFMGVSSNEENALGYIVDKARATEDARLSWQAGIGWHTATTRYVEFPEWMTDYVREVKT